MRQPVIAILFSIVSLSLFACLSPRDHLIEKLSAEWVSRSIYVAARLGIADQLEGGSMSIDDLAVATKTHPEALTKLLRLLAGNEIFLETSDRCFSNTDASRLLLSSHPDSLYAFTLFYGEDLHKSFGELLSSIRSNKPAFELAYQQPIYSYLRENPSRALLYHHAVKEESKGAIDAILAAYDFSEFKTLYDIGGGEGHVLEGIVKRHPKIKGRLFDLPEVAGMIINSHFRSESGDFFFAVPPGGDGYLLKSILHGWDDDKALQILQNCHKAMHSKSKLLVIEVLLNASTPMRFGACMDLLMLTLTGGKERSGDELGDLLQRAGFKIEKTYKTTSEFHIIEATPIRPHKIALARR